MSRSTVNADSLRRIIETNFPDLWGPTEAVLSAICAMLPSDVVNPPSLILVGPSSSSKTTVLDMLADVNDLCYRSDRFTPRAFVSHAANVKREELAKIDLLPRIKHKALVTPELAPIFRGNEETLSDTFAILTAVLDGHGFISDSGVQGRRGYTGDEWLFTWIGATTPLPGHVWRVMAQLGSRLFFYMMPDDEVDDETLDAVIRSDASYRRRLAACRASVQAFLPQRMEDFRGVRGIEWSRKDDPADVTELIRQCAKLVAKLRGVVSVWKERDQEADLSYTPPNVEQPHRALAVLYNLARGHALLYGRTQLTTEDLPVVAHVALSSAPTDRSRLFRGLLDANGTHTTRAVAALLEVSLPTARKAMKSMELLKLADLDEAPTSGEDGTPAQILRLRPDWAWALKPEFWTLL